MTVNNCVDISSVSNTAVIGNGTSFSNLSYDVVPSAAILCERDSSANLQSNSMISAYTTTVKSAGTTTLTVSSTEQQYFTGASAQTVVLPVTSNLVIGQKFEIFNIGSSGNITVQSSGANTIHILNGGSSIIVTCISTSGTTAASWSSRTSTFIQIGAVGGIGIVSSGTPSNVTSLSLTPGAYIIKFTLYINPATSLSSAAIAVNTTSASMAGTLSSNLVRVSGLTITGATTISISSFPTIVTSTTTWYANTQVTYIGATPGGGYLFVAERIA